VAGSSKQDESGEIIRKIVVFEDLVKFVKSAAEASNDPVYGKLQGDNKNHSDDSKLKKRHETHSLATNMSQSISCPLCGQPHDLEECRGFQVKTGEEKRTFLSDKRLCFACFGNGHMSKGCSAKRRCRKCGKPHPTSLHIDDYCPNGNATPQSRTSGNASRSNRYSGAKPTDSSVCTATEVSDSILHAILPVKVSQGHVGKLIAMYAFYDNGSSGCFITDEL